MQPDVNRMLATALVICANVIMEAVQYQLDHPNAQFQTANLIPAERVATFAVQSAGYNVTIVNGAYAIAEDA